MTDTKKKFIRFLKELGAYNAFITNIKNENCDGALVNEDVHSFDGYIAYHNILDLISVAFDWMDSPQSHQYWEYIHRLWVSYAKSGITPIYEYERSELKKLMGRNGF